MPNWTQTRELHRNRLVAKYDASEAKSYDALVGTLTQEDEDAYMADIHEVCPFIAGQSVLDVGAGSGALTKMLCRMDGLVVTALEPSPAMCDLMRGKSQLANVTIVQGGCDRKSERQLFPQACFDAVLSRQLVNCLFDPLVAFQNWFYWLEPGGRVVVIDGTYGRDGWTGVWEDEVDVIPLSACQSMATIPYLMDSIGFRVESVDWMHRTNRLPSTRTKRFIVVATKPNS